MSHKPNAYTVVSITVDVLTFEAECGRFCGMCRATENVEETGDYSLPEYDDLSE